MAAISKEQSANDLHMGQPIPSSIASLKSEMADRSSASLAKLAWETGRPLNGSFTLVDSILLV